MSVSRSVPPAILALAALGMFVLWLPFCAGHPLITGATGLFLLFALPVGVAFLTLLAVRLRRPH